MSDEVKEATVAEEAVEEKIEQTSKVEENSLIVYKEGFFTKLVNKLKKFFGA